MVVVPGLQQRLLDFCITVIHTNHASHLVTTKRLPKPPCRGVRSWSPWKKNWLVFTLFYSENVINPTGCIWASAGYNVHLRDPSLEQLTAGIAYIEQEVSAYATKTGRSPGKAQPFMSLEDAVETAWLVIEAVPEKLLLKISTFAELSACAPKDCILASNSSSYKSSEMLDKVPEEVKPRILNMHYYMPPKCMIVELMTDGFTSDEIFPFMVERCREGATSPYVARKESTGFIFNRLWAAVKREVLTILSEGVSVPEEIDAMWETMFIEGRSVPCKMMDREYCLIPVPPDVLYLLISRKKRSVSTPSPSSNNTTCTNADCPQKRPSTT